MRRPLYVVFALLFATTAAAEQELDFRTPSSPNDPATAAAMRDLAQRALPVYQNGNRDVFLANLSALQSVAGEYAAAYTTEQSLGGRAAGTRGGQPLASAVAYPIYARARAQEAREHVPFDRAFGLSFHDAVARLNDRDAFTFTRALETPPSDFQAALQNALDRLRSKHRITLAEALSLVETYLSFEIFRDIGPLVGALTAEDDRRRYTIEAEQPVMGPHGARLVATVVRPKNAAAPLTSLLQFTIGAYRQDDATECAAHGYAGVVAQAQVRSRTPRGSTYLRDGEDARAVIEWVAAQSWSDGRVGMYGDDYSGFTAWAAAKRPPAALKAIATSSPHAPGIDVPLTADILRRPAQEGAHSGRAAAAAPVRQGDDHAWQRMIPFGRDFAKIDFPVLTVTGYYDDAEVGALYYFAQHRRFNPQADQTLLVGPYDHASIQYGPWAILRGYQVDPAALVDLHEMRYQWFDYVLRRAAAPALLARGVDFETMGANRWGHVGELEAMGRSSLRLYLDATPAANRYRLERHLSSGEQFVAQSVVLAAGGEPSTQAAPVLARSLDAHDALVYVSEALPPGTELSGRFSGALDLTASRSDFAVRIALYELLASGDYFALFDPPYEFRASEAREHGGPRPLRIGRRQSLTFTSDRLTSRRLQAGSRLVVVLGVDPQRTAALTLAPARGRRADAPPETLQLKWYGSSYIDLPVGK